jgi:hypothetical protein
LASERFVGNEFSQCRFPNHEWVLSQSWLELKVA